MSDVLARAAEVLGAHGIEHIAQVGDEMWCATCDQIIGTAKDTTAEEEAQVYAHQAQMLADAGLLAESACPQRPTTHETLDSLTARLVAARAATDGYRTEAERLRELLDEAHAKIERMEEL